MIQVPTEVCIDASAEQVWRALSEIEDVAVWANSVTSARCDGTLKRGVGAKRRCQLRGGGRIEEVWTAWDEGRSFSYEARGLLLMRRATNTWTVQPQGERTLLRSEVQLEYLGGPLGRLLEPLARGWLERTASSGLAGFKYWVEEGEPPPSAHGVLPHPVPCL